MSSLSGVAIKYNGQHIEMGSSRRSRDFGDACKYVEWLKKRNPFTYDDPHLHSLANGKSIHINPTVLFTRLAAIAQRDDNVEQYFGYEMTPASMS